MELLNKFISPNHWFSFDIPSLWYESEDAENVFLFNNPEEWTGNFRISAYQGVGNYAKKSVDVELRENGDAKKVIISGLTFAYFYEDFVEDGSEYTSHFWIGGKDSILVECSFTCVKNEDISVAVKIINSLHFYPLDERIKAQLIPVRCFEIYQINEAYDRMSKLIKEKYAVDFQGLEKDIPLLQRLLEDTEGTKKIKEVAVAIGLVICCICTNETEGYQWATLIDGDREVPVLFHKASKTYIDASQIVWKEIKKEPQNKAVDLKSVYYSLLN